MKPDHLDSATLRGTHIIYIYIYVHGHIRPKSSALAQLRAAPPSGFHESMFTALRKRCGICGPRPSHALAEHAELLPRGQPAIFVKLELHQFRMAHARDFGNPAKGTRELSVKLAMEMLATRRV